MLSGPTLIVLGQTIILGLSPNATTGDTSGVYIPGISNPLHRNVTRREDYTYTPGIGAHKVHNTLATWMEASKTCLAEGGHLAVINSAKEADIIANLIAAAGPASNSYSPDNTWIGIHDLISQTGDWQTVFSQSLLDAGFEEWHESKSTGGAHCGAVYKNGRFTWLACPRDLAFVCEIPDGQLCSLGDGTTNLDASWWIRESIRELLAEG